MMKQDPKSLIGHLLRILTVLVSVSWVLRNSRNPLETFGPSRFCDISPGSARMWDELKVQFSGQLPTSILLGILLKHSPTFSFVIEMVKCVCGDPSHTNYWKSLELNLTKTIFTSILSVYKVEFRDFWRSLKKNMNRYQVYTVKVNNRNINGDMHEILGWAVVRECCA